MLVHIAKEISISGNGNGFRKQIARNKLDKKIEKLQQERKGDLA